MALLSFTVRPAGSPLVSAVSDFRNGSASRNDIALHIGRQTRRQMTSCKVSPARLICKGCTAFITRLEGEAASSKSEKQVSKNATSADPNVVGSATNGLLTADDFSTGEKSGLVSVGSHHLFLQTAGPDRKPGEPVVILIPGVGSSSKGFAAVFRLLQPFVRVYLYDRAGYGESELSPEKPTSSTIISELDLLLRNANVAPPYIFVGHSWGGMLSREFFALRPDDVAGMLLIEANQERTLEVLDWREPKLWSIAGKVDFFEYTGQNQDHRLTEEEWRAYVEDQKSRRHKKQSLKERSVYPKSFPVLAEKGQLHRKPDPVMGNRPLSVVMGNQGRDWRRLYDEAKKRGYGTEEERAFFLEYLQKFDDNHPKLQKELLSLSNNYRFLSAPESGHDVQLTQPDLIVDEVKWILEQCRSNADGEHSKVLADATAT